MADFNPTCNECPVDELRDEGYRGAVADLARALGVEAERVKVDEVGPGIATIPRTLDEALRAGLGEFGVYAYEMMCKGHGSRSAADAFLARNTKGDDREG